MKEFFKPNKTNVIITAFLFAILVLVQNSVIGPYKIGQWGYSVIEFVFAPIRIFKELSLWLVFSFNPFISESTESISPQINLANYLVVWPLALAYFYILTTTIQKIIKKLLS